MTLRFGLACMGFLGACSFVFVGCGDDDVTDTGESSKGGEAGAGARGGSGGDAGEGASGQGGSAGDGARGGTAGAAGRGGTAGAAGGSGTAGSGGSDATGGFSGDAGGGPLGGEGGFGGEGGAGTGPGGAGNAGEAGAGGAPDTTADQCKYECVDDDDCARGIDTSYKCHPTRKRCENPNLACDSHDDCLPVASGWIGTCTSDVDCTPLFEECVDVGGRGLCASIPYLGTCFTGAEMQMPRFGTKGMTTVCGSDAGRCDAMGQCFTGCTDPAQQCTVLGGRGPNCNATTGLCECTTDSECTAMGVSRCNMTTHLCECGSNTDCPSSAGADECVSGRCGCSSATICSTTLFPNATAVCE